MKSNSDLVESALLTVKWNKFLGNASGYIPVRSCGIQIFQGPEEGPGTNSATASQFALELIQSGQGHVLPRTWGTVDARD